MSWLPPSTVVLLLLVVSLCAQDSKPAGVEEIHEFRRRHTKALMDAPDVTAMTSEELEAFWKDPKRNWNSALVPEAVALARKHAGTMEAVQTWNFVLTSSEALPAKERAAWDKEALAAIKATAAEPWCRSMVTTVAELRSRWTAKEVLEVLEIARKSADSGSAGEALLALARMKAAPGSEAGRKEALALLDEAVEKHGDAKDFRGTIRERAARRRFGIERIRAGAVCPEFTAVDQTGAAVGTTALAGRPFLLCFWSPLNTGFAKLKRELNDFAKCQGDAGTRVYGVVASGDAESVVAIVAREKLGFPQLVDPFSGGLEQSWDLEGRPFAFVVVDRGGKIRWVGSEPKAAIDAATKAATPSTK